ncbi:hypothetical protein [Bacillus mycoides]|uniref:hypothetical protein n=1 Tax=Bacillus mycoides TaxID=1405 RepID=UPI0011ECE266|nr:hypothetical protein [Bacillus mycoides]QEL88194.1 hypothetical protein DN409_28200 [Bacillus mycoides]
MKQYQFMFWNVKLSTQGDDYNKRLENIMKVIVETSKEYNLDFILLAEAQKFNTQEMLKLLNYDNEKYRVGIEEDILLDTKQRFVILHTIDKESVVWQDIDPKRRILSTYYNLYGTKILINLVHLRDKYNYSDKTLDGYARNHAKYIRRLEDEFEIKNSLMVGDFNLNPYQDGMISVDAFNAIMCPNIASKDIRVWDGNKYKYFYNPTWSVFGKQSDGQVLGTYFYNNSSELDLAYWHMLDQLLLRKDMLDFYKFSSLEIISKIKTIELTNDKDIPNAVEYSDHLPIKFTIEIKGDDTL